jgi:hypothetical protein
VDPVPARKGFYTYHKKDGSQRQDM